MSTARRHQTATLLHDGRVLVVGGNNPGSPGLTPFATAEIFDPVTDSFTPTGSMNVPRTLHTATRLANGKVLVTGGWNGSLDASLQSAEVWDPATGTFSFTTTTMNQARSQHTATLLSNGKVLIAAGWGTGPLQNAELYDPATSTFTTTGSLGTARNTHTATLLPDGRVLIAGGFGAALLSSAEIFNPATGINGGFTATGLMLRPRGAHTANRMADGTVLLFGGDDSDDSQETYDPSTGTFGNGQSLDASSRFWHTSLATDFSQAFIAGGGSEGSWFSTTATATNGALLADRFSFPTPTASMSTPRWGAAMTQLKNDRILVVGGGSNTAEIHCLENKVVKILPIAAQTVNEGATLQFTLPSNLCDDENLSSVEAIDLPEGASFDSESATFTWTPTSAQAGTYYVTFFRNICFEGPCPPPPTQVAKIVVNNTIVDTDRDGVADITPDNCVDVANADQSDLDGDQIGDVCDPTPIGAPFAGLVTHATTVAPPASPGGYNVGDPILLTATVTFQPLSNRPYFAVRPTQYNVLSLVDGVAGANRLQEGPPLGIYEDSPDLVKVDGQAVTLTTTFDLTHWYTALTHGKHSVQLNYVNLAKDPDTVSTDPGEVCNAGTDCLTTWMGIAPAGKVTINIRNSGITGDDTEPLVDYILGLNISRGLANSLIAKVRASRAAAQRGDLVAACGTMDAFLNEVSAQNGKGLTALQASQLTTSANEIKQLMGCK